MASIFDQENLTTIHQTTAVNKPLNQAVRNLQPKTPGNNLKTPFRARNDENTFTNIGKTGKNTFVTPGPAPRTEARAPLGAKTTNAKAHAFQTPAPAQKAIKSELTAKKASSTRRTTKKKIYVETEQPLQSDVQHIEQDDEPDSGYAPLPIVPLPDPPLEFDVDQTYPALRPENFNRGVGEIYFQSPKDENGFSISLKKIEQEDRESLQRDLDRILESTKHKTKVVDDVEEEIALIQAADQRRSSRNSGRLNQAPPRIQHSNISTLNSRSAATALSQNQPARTYVKAHARLPSATTAQTTASKQKRKSTFAIPRDTDLSLNSRPPPSISNATIGFPKAKKAPSILSRFQSTQPTPHSWSKSQTSGSSLTEEEEETDVDTTAISPRKFVQLHGQPTVDSDMWLRLKELEIRDRRRDDGEEDHEEESIFDFDDEELDQRLARGFGGLDEDFELTMN